MNKPTSIDSQTNEATLPTVSMKPSEVGREDTGTEAITIRNFNSWYGDFHALKEITLTFLPVELRP